MALGPMQNRGEVYQPEQRMHWALLFTLLLWEVDMNVVSEGQMYYQLALLILFCCECKCLNTILSFDAVEHSVV